MNELYDIYTNKHGHEVATFGSDQAAVEYAKENYNDPNDKPKVFKLVRLDVDGDIEREKAELAKWERKQSRAHIAGIEAWEASQV